MEEKIVIGHEDAHSPLLNKGTSKTLMQKNTGVQNLMFKNAHRNSVCSNEK